ncbi:MAG: helix-turn-helix transcriptional regulator [Chloroflexi bacterium]|nr:helix-turn-helix transcriptional regulator [Chloroflexota bacterium]
MPGETVETPQGSVRVSLRLEEARRRRGFKSWAEVARRGGIGATPLSHLVQGKVRLSEVRLGTLVKLAAAMGVGLDEIVDLDTSPIAPLPRGDRPITPAEFADAVRHIVSAPLPSDWTGPAEEDLAEVTPLSASGLQNRLRRDRAALDRLTSADSADR